MTNIIREVCIWNYVRENVEFNKRVEEEMLQEEVEELYKATTPTDIADALADIIFVAVGSLYKFTEGSELKLMAIMDAVIQANHRKGTEKINGKIVKPTDFVGPEDTIRSILENGQLTMNFEG